jgi:hypothetical protein
MGMFDFITKPINFILDAAEFFSCVLAFIGNFFKWTGLAITECIKVILVFPFCSGFYLLHTIIDFVSFIVFDVLLIIITYPIRWLADALGFPLNDLGLTLKVLGFPLTTRNNKNFLREMKSYFKVPKLYRSTMPYIFKTCYSFNGLPPFPEWNLKVPTYGK